MAPDLPTWVAVQRALPIRPPIPPPMSVTQKLLAAAAAVAFLAPAARAQTTLTFETTGASAFSFLPAGYGGFTWTNVLLLPSGYGGAVSGSWAAYTHCCASGAVEVTRATPFRLVGAWLTDYSEASGDRIVGYLGATEVFDRVMAFDGGAPRYNDFSSTGAVDRLVWKNADGSTENVGNTLLDDLTFADDLAFAAPAVTATPEPASVALMATGLAGLAAVARRRRVAARG